MYIVQQGKLEPGVCCCSLRSLHAVVASRGGGAVEERHIKAEYAVTRGAPVGVGSYVATWSHIDRLPFCGHFIPQNDLFSYIKWVADNNSTCARLLSQQSEEHEVSCNSYQHLGDVLATLLTSRRQAGGGGPLEDIPCGGNPEEASQVACACHTLQNMCSEQGANDTHQRRNLLAMPSMDELAKSYANILSSASLATIT